MKDKSNKFFKKIMLILLAVTLICFGSAAIILKSSGFSPSLMFENSSTRHYSLFSPWTWRNFAFNIGNQMDSLGDQIESLVEDNVKNNTTLKDAAEFTDDKSCTITDSTSEINISTVSSELVIAPTDSNEIKAMFYLKGIEGAATLNVDESDSKVDISVKYKNNLNFDMLRSSKLMVYIPMSYNKSLKISTVSGDGNIDLSSLNLNDVSINTTSGDFEIKKLSTLTANLSSVSGDMSINESFTGNELKMKSTSGDIDVDSPFGRTEMTTVSGTINFSSYNNIKGSLDAKTTSGEVEISMGDTPFNLEGNTASGDFDIAKKYNANISRKHISISNGNDYSIRVSTVSGDLDMR
ncbi:MAG: hypothetical protein DBY38_04675 [Clostridium cadaveris]|uniref:DUF4097 domain-containing protein n=1 Tax=Clostridium cadaveris TaxID=1529 RepID=A0A316MBD6_9CLOT|nr:MAG: hypothetical protein DBY38_04675 [Clostridium cadaveris]